MFYSLHISFGDGHKGTSIILPDKEVERINELRRIAKEIEILSETGWKHTEPIEQIHINENQTRWEVIPISPNELSILKKKVGIILSS
ncbi:MAG: hypothetical protein WC632_06015 [Candidatus Margulisiibacteriota bacterium]